MVMYIYTYHINHYFTESDLYFGHCPLLKYALVIHHIHGHVFVLFLPRSHGNQAQKL